jgi:hypothetical protein
VTRRTTTTTLSSLPSTTGADAIKPSNRKDATPAQYLEHLRMLRGLDHARQIRDELGWRYKPPVMVWTLRHSGLAVAVSTVSVCALVVGLIADVMSLVR